MTVSSMRKVLTLAVPALVVALLTALLRVQAWVRLQWDHRQGEPGFYLSEPVLGQRLAPGYDGWFAGVPVRMKADVLFTHLRDDVLGPVAPQGDGFAPGPVRR